MEFAFAKAVMTPDTPVFLSGFGSRTEPAERVHDDIHARVALIRANEPLVFIALDVMAGDSSFVDGVKETIERELAIPPQNVLVSFSHSHASIGVTGEDPSKRTDMEGWYSMAQSRPVCMADPSADYSGDVRYYRRVRDLIVGMLADCSARLEPGDMRIGRRDTFIGVSRRLVTPAGVVWAPAMDAVIDRDLFVLSFLSAAGSVRGLIYAAPCHPTGLGAIQELSAEFPGYASAELERRFSGCIALFLQADGGEIRPRLTGRPDGSGFRSYSFEECAETGRELAGDVSALLERGMREVEPEIRATLRRLHLRAEIADPAELLRRAEAELVEYRKRRLREIAATTLSGRPRCRIPFSISRWELGGGHRIIATEGELLSSLGLKIKGLFGDGRTIVLGYANGMPCYVAPREVIEEGGYERDSFIEGSLSGPLVPETEDTILGALAAGGTR